MGTNENCMASFFFIYGSCMTSICGNFATYRKNLENSFLELEKMPLQKAKKA